MDEKLRDEGPQKPMKKPRGGEPELATGHANPLGSASSAVCFWLGTATLIAICSTMRQIPTNFRLIPTQVIITRF
ncbi:unnamed protein product [Caenorhabditis auriculariae]|uniref:Uncharacterized protein n=1 Tax=Caenorhabditis auriculariae TaxID=2777116 RepID=A0A8S1HY62_9PELO|nr:unnamed protein product [Caenorhabditis auriculariae]